MKIYGSTQYVRFEDEPIEWLQMSVNNMWDFGKKDICFTHIGNNIIGYSLYKNTRVSEREYKAELITDITEEIAQELINKGFILSCNL